MGRRIVRKTVLNFPVPVRKIETFYYLINLLYEFLLLVRFRRPNAYEQVVSTYRRTRSWDKGTLFSRIMSCMQKKTRRRRKGDLHRVSRYHAYYIRFGSRSLLARTFRQPFRHGMCGVVFRLYTRFGSFPYSARHQVPRVQTCGRRDGAVVRQTFA